jgi:predicted ATP-dependent endonuclease of OLD family
MRICRIRISNFRGIREATLLLPTHAVLIGDNNTGKTTILEALDLATRASQFFKRIMPSIESIATSEAVGLRNYKRSCWALVLTARTLMQDAVGILNR